MNSNPALVSDKTTPDRTITDLRCALPVDGWTDEDSTVFQPVSRPGAPAWRAVQYECDTHKGYMLWGNGGQDAILRIPLQAEGWHALHLLIAYADLEARLSGENQWQRIRAYPPRETVTDWHEAGMWGRPLIWEPLRFADLTDRELEIRIPPVIGVAAHPPYAMAGLWGVRVTPMQAGHVDLLSQARAKRAVYINDGFGVFFHSATPEPGLMEKTIKPFLTPRWNTCCYGIGQRGYPNYPSKLVDYERDKGWAFVRKGEGYYKTNVKAAIDRGEDSLQIAADLTHTHNQKIWMYLRPQLWSMPLPFDHSFYSAFYASHPHLRCREADGQPIAKMSIAYPEIRDHFAAFIAEGLKRGVDGICLALIRGYPLVRYEQPVLERMQERFGMDARTLPETDERLQQVWAEFVTDWIREIRRQLDKACPADGCGRKELAAFVPNKERCALFGFDLAGWVKEGLIDVLMPSGSKAEELSFLVELVRSSDVQLVPDIRGGIDKTIHSLRAAAHACYELGADGLTFWDTEEYLDALDLHLPEVQALWHAHYMPDRCVAVRSISGEYLTPYNPALGG